MKYLIFFVLLKNESMLCISEITGYLFAFFIFIYTRYICRYILLLLYVRISYVVFMFQLIIFSFFFFRFFASLMRVCCAEIMILVKNTVLHLFKEGKVGVEGRFFLRHEFFLFFVFVLCQPATYYR